MTGTARRHAILRPRPFTWGLLLAILPLLAQPGNPPPKDPAALRQRLAEIQQRMGQLDQRMQALKKRRKGILVELQGISLQADQARAQAEGARLKRDQTLAEVQEINQMKEGIQREILRLRADLRRQTRWMQALGPWGSLGIFPSLTSFQSFLEQGRYLAYWRNQERLKLARVQQLQADLQAREKELQEALKRLGTEERRAADLQQALQLHENRLQDFLGGIRQDEGRQKAFQAELAEEAIQLERMITSLISRSRSESYHPDSPFPSLKGELPRPIEGSLARGFGEHIHPKFRTKTMQSGLLITAPPGTPVTAVAGGKVVFADAYQSYGPMVILDHGGSYFSLYTHLQVASVTKGQAIRLGEQIGVAGEMADGPGIGFEIRYLAQPQDPNKWLKQKYR